MHIVLYMSEYAIEFTIEVLSLKNSLPNQYIF